MKWIFRNRRFLHAVMLICMILQSGCRENLHKEGKEPSPGLSPPPPSAQSAAPVWTFGIIYPMVNPTYETITQKAEATASVHNIQLLVQAPDEANLEQQIRIMEMMIKRKVDGIAIDPVDSASLIPVINKAVAQGIPVICFESDSPGSNRSAYVGADNYRTGAVLGEEVGRLLDGRGMILVGTGMPHMLGLNQRLDGLLDYLSQHTMIDVLEVRSNDGSEASALLQLEQMIEAHPHFSAFISLDFVSASSSILVWKAKGLKRSNVALGLTPFVEEAVNNGQITAVISQNEQTWGEAIIRTLLSLVLEEEIGEFIDTGITRQLAP
ncbi:substrate-binding domain-containing protein [Paenibacillus albidus]|uniref:sugar ABC transporter substrate-binding protein n=1 Tax=Paenibacillus albidus TaxID=2041023 RepID=UPI001BEA1105|nr:substrate-binding domain-containing protein [Paenibacillus albidus]MBT2291880.1 substrate-binding domain-containing protein [Paenibacillus albidus]